MQQYIDPVLKHISNYFDLPSAQCPHCGKISSNKTTLSQHIASMHSEADTHTCNICGKTFNARKKWNRHMQNHKPDNEKKYQCEICKKGFNVKIIYEGHMNSHNNLKPFNCDICGSAFQNE